MLSFNNDQQLKKAIVTEMEKHSKNDQIIKGTYGEMNGKWRGCAVGCAIHSINAVLKKEFETDDHTAFEKAIGPEWLARLQDSIFEGLPEVEAPQFAVDF